MSSSQNRVRLSRFTHFIETGNDYTGILNSLSLDVLVVRRDFAKLLKEVRHFDFSKIETLMSIQLAEELIKRHLLIPETKSELDDLKSFQEHLKHAPVGILYLILSDACNINCSYCYFEEAIPANYTFSKMKIETARLGIDVFAKILTVSISRGLDEPQIIIYGGEPLSNWQVLRLSLEYIHKLRESGILPENTSVTINSNGTLITEEIAKVLAAFSFVTLAVSIDGPKDIHDFHRVDRMGLGTYDRVHAGIKMAKTMGVNVGLCCTLTHRNIERAEEILIWMQETYGISSLGFNILLETPKPIIADRIVYAEKVADKLISCFLVARKHGIYEDRIMRKVKSFVEGDTYFYDCGGCGQQLVVSPNGKVGVCQAYCGTKKYFTDLTDGFDPKNHSYWKEWRMRSPLNMPQCIDCIALGNCGGGCPYSAESRMGSIWSLDDVFCIFSRKTINFLVRDLIEQMTVK